VAIALHSSIISRLQKHWQIIKNDKKYLGLTERLHQLVNGCQNYKTMQAEHKKLTPPCVPWITLFKANFEKGIEACSVCVKEKINIKQATIVAKILFEFEVLQAGDYSFEKDPEFIAFLESWETLEEADYHDLSLQIEPRDL